MARQHSRIKRSDNDLLAISDHLLYEIQMLFGTAQALLTFEDSNHVDFEKKVIYNSLLESFTVHSRVLLDFLYSSDARRDDVIAEDFFDNNDFVLYVVVGT